MFDLLRDRSKENIKNVAYGETTIRRYNYTKRRREIANGRASGLLDRDFEIEVPNIKAENKRVF